MSFAACVLLPVLTLERSNPFRLRQETRPPPDDWGAIVGQYPTDQGRNPSRINSQRQPLSPSQCDMVKDEPGNRAPDNAGDRYAD